MLSLLVLGVGGDMTSAEVFRSMQDPHIARHLYADLWGGGWAWLSACSFYSLAWMVIVTA